MPRHRGASRSATSNDRTVNHRSRHQRILIICEGVQTEPNYFSAIIRIHRLNGRVVQGRSLNVSVSGLGTNTLSLVEHAQRQLQTFDEAWCVFDNDSFPNDNFDNAIAKIASTPKLFAAWSNEAFELKKAEELRIIVYRWRTDIVPDCN